MSASSLLKQSVAVAVAAVTTAFPGSLLLDVQLKKESRCPTWLLSVTGEWKRNSVGIEKYAGM